MKSVIKIYMFVLLFFNKKCYKFDIFSHMCKKIHGTKILKCIFRYKTKKSRKKCNKGKQIW